MRIRLIAAMTCNVCGYVFRRDLVRQVRFTGASRQGINFEIDLRETEGVWCPGCEHDSAEAVEILEAEGP